MTQALTRHAPGAAPAVPARPQLSRWLADAVRDASNPHPDVGPQLHALPDQVREEARGALARLDAHMRAATADEWARFLKPLVASTGANLSREEFAAKVGAIAFALPDTPAALLTIERQREAVRRFAWFPKPPEIAELLKADHVALRRERNALQAIAGSSSEPPPEPISEEQRAAMAQRLQALAADLRASEPSRRGATTGRASPLSEGDMLACYRRLAADGSAAAAMRVAALERRMALDA